MTKLNIKTAVIAISSAAVLLSMTGCLRVSVDEKTTVPEEEIIVVDEPALLDYTIAPDPLTLSVMRAKLLHSHMLLEAVTLQDFSRIEQNAAALKSLSEESDWHVHATLSYRIFSDRFQEIMEAMEMHARQRDVDGVARDYAMMTAICFDCHGYLRREGLVRDLPGAISWRRTRLAPFGG